MFKRGELVRHEPTGRYGLVEWGPLMANCFQVDFGQYHVLPEKLPEEELVSLGANMGLFLEAKDLLFLLKATHNGKLGSKGHQCCLWHQSIRLGGLGEKRSPREI